MKKNEILSIATIGLSSILYFVYNLINLIQSKEFNLWTNVGAAFYTILLVVALAYAVMEKKYLAGLAVTMLKITIPYGTKFLNPLLTRGIVEFDVATDYFYLIFAILLVVSVVALILEANNTQFVGSKYNFKTFLGPLLVLSFLLLFNRGKSPAETAIISSLAEVISLLLLAVMTAEFLFISVFISVPFDFVQLVVNDEVQALDYVYLVVGVGLLLYGVYALIAHIKHAQHEEHGQLVH